MKYKLRSYKGKTIKGSEEVLSDLGQFLAILANRESDHYTVNLRTFRSDKVKAYSSDVSAARILAAFLVLQEAGICSISKGSMGRLEKVRFKEPVRIVARTLLGLEQVLVVSLNRRGLS